MRYRKASEPTDEWTGPYVSIYCDAPSHGEWKLYTFTWMTSAFGGGFFGLARDYCDRDGRARSYVRGREFQPRQFLEGDGEDSKVLRQGEAPSGRQPLRESWSLKCERCGLAVRARDEKLQRALQLIRSVGETHVTLSALGAIVRR